jgi:hypothetical protein
MKLLRWLYARPEIVRGEQCTGGAGRRLRDDDAERSNLRAASNPPAAKPHVATASIVSLHCNMGAERHRCEGTRGCVLRCEQLARQWHARGQGFKSPQLHPRSGPDSPSAVPGSPARGSRSAATTVAQADPSPTGAPYRRRWLAPSRGLTFQLRSPPRSGGIRTPTVTVRAHPAPVQNPAAQQGFEPGRQVLFGQGSSGTVRGRT